MRRLVLVVLALSFAVLGGAVDPTRAYACDCPGISTRRALDQSDAAFTGTVRSQREVGSDDNRRIDLRFDVTRVYKGEVFSSQLVSTPVDSAACGLTPEVGSSWTIFADTQLIGEGREAITRLRTTVCDGNLPGTSPPALLGRGDAPQAGESDRAERAVAADLRTTRVLQIAGLTALGLAAVVGLAVLVLWRRPHHL